VTLLASGHASPRGKSDRTLLMVVATRDHVVPPDIQLKTYARALESKKLLLPGGHVDPYRGETFHRNSADQLAWFAAHLSA
jgi:fermentation-respiration switch protein FrsA (DUF1100 family)